MAINNFVYWSDGLGGREFDYHSRNGGLGICQQKLLAGPGICQQKLLAGPGIWTIFSNARAMPGGLPGGDARGWNWLAHNLHAGNYHKNVCNSPCLSHEWWGQQQIKWRTPNMVWFFQKQMSYNLSKQHDSKGYNFCRGGSNSRRQVVDFCKATQFMS